MVSVGVIADDCSGAAEVAAAAAGLGHRAQVVLDLQRAGAEDHQLAVVDTDSRHAPPEQAAARLRAALAWLRRQGAQTIYKKTDSTLRGNIASELAALQQAEPALPLIYLPAHPAAGRTCVAGTLLVDGTPVGQTALARDPQAPVRCSDLPQLLAAGGLRVEHVELARLRAGGWSVRPGVVTVLDGERVEDLTLAVAQLEQTPCLWAGAGAGIAPVLADLALPRSRAVAPPLAQPLLVVVGSRHPASLAQLRQLQAQGACALQVDPQRILCDDDDQTWLERQLGAARAAWSLGRLVVLHSASQEAEIPAYERAAATAAGQGCAAGWLTARFAALGAELIRRLDPSALLVMGGATCRALCARLGIASLSAHREPLPGVALCSASDAGGRRRVVVTKNGAFGGPRLVEELLCCSV